jgi:hypothetical protein
VNLNEIRRNEVVGKGQKKKRCIIEDIEYKAIMRNIKGNYA